MSDILIRRALPEDAERIAFIEKNSIREAWSQTQISEQIEKKDSVFLTALYDDAVIGYISADMVVDEVYINNIAVDEKYRKHGAADRLMEELERVFSDRGAVFITLEVRSENRPAIGLYEKRGYRKAGVRKNFYSSPRDDALIYTKYFNSENV